MNSVHRNDGYSLETDRDFRVFKKKLKKLISKQALYSFYIRGLNSNNLFKPGDLVKDITIEPLGLEQFRLIFTISTVCIGKIQNIWIL